MMDNQLQAFVYQSRAFLNDVFFPKLKNAVDQLSDEDLWWRPNEVSNSIGNLILHLSGNLRMWIVAALGGVAIHRDREAEFKERQRIPKAELLSTLQQALQETNQVLAGIQEDVLLRKYKISRYDITGTWAIYHVVEHFSYHLGQILYIFKLRTGRAPQ